MSRGWFVAGTDTGVGKTLVAATLIHLLAKRGDRVVGMKPVASGCHSTEHGLRNNDAQMLMAAANVDAEYVDINPYAFQPPISPHLAAQEVGIKIELENVFKHFEILKQKSETIVVEGVGGWMAPLGHVITNEHLAKALGLPVVLVVGLRLGCISHALLTVRAIEAAGVALAGWIANTTDPGQERIEETVTTLSQRLSAPMLGQIPYTNQCDFRSVSRYISLP